MLPEPVAGLAVALGETVAEALAVGVAEALAVGVACGVGVGVGVTSTVFKLPWSGGEYLPRSQTR